MLKNVWPIGLSFSKRRDWYRTVFLASESWQRTSRSYRAEHPICEECGKSPSRQCHHTSFGYSVLGFESQHPGALMAVCVPCHKILDKRRKKEHVKKNGNRTPSSSASKEVALDLILLSLIVGSVLWILSISRA